MTKKPGEIS